MSTGIDVIKDAMQAQGLRMDKIETALDKMAASIERSTKTKELLTSSLRSGVSPNPKAAELLSRFCDGDVTMRADESPAEFVERKMRGNELVTVGKGHTSARIKRKMIPLATMIRFARLSKFNSSSQNAPDFTRAVEQAKLLGDDDMASLFEEARDLRASTAGMSGEQLRNLFLTRLGSSSLSGGGAFVPLELADEYIKLLTAASTVRKFGVKIMNLSAGQLMIPDLRTGMTASYESENSGPNASEPTFGDIVLSAKILTSLIPLSQEWRNRAAWDVDAMLADTVLRVAAAREDLAFIRGDGTDNTPKGIKKWIDEYNSAQTFARTLSGGVPTAATIIADLAKSMRLVEDNNVAMEGGGFILPIREKYALMTLRDSVGGFLFRDEMAGGSLMGHQYEATSQIPKTLAGDGSGTGTNNKSEIYFCAFPNAIIGEETSAEVEVIPNAAYLNSSGTLVSGVSRREDVVRFTGRHDFALSYRGQEAAYISSVDWGA